MAFNKIIRIPENPRRADKSAVGAINSAPTEGWIILLICIVGQYGEPDEVGTCQNQPVRIAGLVW